MKTLNIVIIFVFLIFSFSSPSFARCFVPAVSAPTSEACGVCAGIWTKARLSMFGLTQEEKIKRTALAYEWLYTNREWKRNKCVLNTVTRGPSYDDLKKENEYLENELIELRRQLDKN